MLQLTFSNTPRHRPGLICFSHLRWNFVYQRPQHLLSRAAVYADVFYFEEPIFDSAEPKLVVAPVPPAVYVLAPPVPPAASTGAAEVPACELLDSSLVGRCLPDGILSFYA